jgi:2,3-bisphosphoglycerate-independent phosphoglycerate mutase
MAPVALIVLDGFGLAPPGPGNAVFLAETPNFDAIWQHYPHTELAASGLAVGLPEGQIGNSEVGHMNLGAGRVVMQKQTYIQDLIDKGDFYNNEVLRQAYKLRSQDNALHLMGLVSSGGVHSDLIHLYALLELAQQVHVPRVFIHAFTDGRDVGPSTARQFMEELSADIGEREGVEIATVCGRYYAMDRDKRWDRTKLAYDAIVCGRAEFTATSGAEAIETAYRRGEFDEFIKPTVIVDEEGNPIGPIQDGDSVFFFNFRGDRARQLTYALLLPDYENFERCRVVRDIQYSSLMEYAGDVGRPHAFALPDLSNPLGEVLATHGKTQYHTAETEKYPHVTYFFNAMREGAYEGEERLLVPSPKVATYDLQPEMSAPALTASTVARIRNNDDDFILLNFANPDMVGHTGVLEAAIAACEAADDGLGHVLDALRAKGGRAIVVADHGNAEQMFDAEGGPHTAHTTNPVPCVLVDDNYRGRLRDGGKLGDVAPTILDLMGLPQPPEMTGESLLVRDGE